MPVELFLAFGQHHFCRLQVSALWDHLYKRPYHNFLPFLSPSQSQCRDHRQSYQTLLSLNQFQLGQRHHPAHRQTKNWNQLTKSFKKLSSNVDFTWKSASSTCSMSLHWKTAWSAPPVDTTVLLSTNHTTLVTWAEWPLYFRHLEPRLTQGNRNSLTKPKSSPVAMRPFSKLTLKLLTSFSWEYLGKTPSTLHVIRKPCEISNTEF